MTGLFGFQDIKRMEGHQLEFLHRQVFAIKADPSPCEICHLAPNQHIWMDLDRDGFAVACSNQKEAETGDTDTAQSDK
jgi:hypothetical protein